MRDLSGCSNIQKTPLAEQIRRSATTLQSMQFPSFTHCTDSSPVTSPERRCVLDWDLKSQEHHSTHGRTLTSCVVHEQLSALHKHPRRANRGRELSTTRHKSQALKHCIAEPQRAEDIHSVLVVADIVRDRISPSLGTNCRAWAFGRVGEPMNQLFCKQAA